MKHTQKIWMVVCLALILTALAACGKKNDTAKVTPTEAATPTAEPTAEATPTEVPQTPTPTVSEKQQWYDKMIADSLMSTGNNARLKKVIERARNGEDIYIVTIGGSITEGAGAKAYDNC